VAASRPAQITTNERLRIAASPWRQAPGLGVKRRLG
jgi:hypothetical protein